MISSKGPSTNDTRLPLRLWGFARQRDTMVEHLKVLRKTPMGSHTIPTIEDEDKEEKGNQNVNIWKLSGKPSQFQLYRVVLLTVPFNFQYQNEKRWTANQRFCAMKFSMYKRSSIVEQRLSF